MGKIVISEFMDEAAVQRLARHHDVVYDPALVDVADRLLAEAGQCDALVVRNRTQVRGELLARLVAAGRCKAVGRLGVGLDNIDVDGCREAGIAVLPATGANARSVAEYVLTAALFLLRGVFAATPDVAAGRWPRAALSNGREAAGKTLGLVGFGSIGQATAQLATAIGMQVVAFDAQLEPADPVFARFGVNPVGFDALLARADVVSLHVPLVESTRGLFDAARLARLKRGAVLINTARGGIVDMAALVRALRDGHLGGAAIDVFDTEPLPAIPDWAACPNLLLSPHVAGLSSESNDRVSELVANRVLETLAAG